MDEPKMVTPQKNRIELRQLTEEEGSGWLATFPELPGCMSDGETPEEALLNAAEAETVWLAVNEKWRGSGAHERVVWQLVEIKQALLEADAGDFATDEEMVQLNTKWGHREKA